MKFVRTVLLALLFSLFVGLVIGTVLRQRMEKPTIYLGSTESSPFDIGDSRALVLHAGHDKEQVG